MPDLTSLTTAAVFLVLAFICLKWLRLTDPLRIEDGNEQRKRHGASTQGVVVGGARMNVGSMFSSPENILYVEYTVGEKEREYALKVSTRFFNRYSSTLKRLQKEYKKTGIRPPKEEMPQITLHYRMKEPDVVWCDDSLKKEQSQGRMFMFLGIACLAMAAFFAASSF